MPSAESKPAQVQPREGRGRAHLPLHDVGAGVDEDLVAGFAEHAQRHLVAHRPGREEERGLLAEELGGVLLEAIDARVFARLVVADRGRGHDAPHLLAGARLGVAAQVDGVHGAATSA